MNTESLELRRLKTDLVTMYKILLSSTSIDSYLNSALS